MSTGAAEERRYTVEEANAMLPELRERLERIREARQVLLREAELVRERVVVDGGGTHAGRTYRASAERIRSELERFTAEGILLRDPETGLVDFPAERDDAPVYLCWRADEDRVTHWHPLDTGFAGRRPL